jgi:hypothetical protein
MKKKLRGARSIVSSTIEKKYNGGHRARSVQGVRDTTAARTLTQMRACAPWAGLWPVSNIPFGVTEEQLVGEFTHAGRVLNFRCVAVRARQWRVARVRSPRGGWERGQPAV